MKEKSRTIIVVLLCIAMMVPNAGIVQAETVNDIANHWARAYISEWLEKNLATGYPDGTFGPDDIVTRAQFFSFVNRAFNFTEEKEIDFTDVKAADWFIGDIKKASKAGYIEGFGEQEIKPQQNMTRQEAAVILFRVLKLESVEEQNFTARFKDSNLTASKYRKEINAVIRNNLMNGTPEGMFMPEHPITRAETITVLSRAAQLLTKPVRLDKGGTYVLGTVEGNVHIPCAGVVLKDTIINGDLIMDITYGGGNPVLENVKVLGKFIIKSSRSINIELIDCSMEEVTVEKESEKVRLVAKGCTIVKNAVLQSMAALEEVEGSTPGFVNVIIGESVLKGTDIFLYGNFDELLLIAKGVRVALNSGIINNLTVAKNAEGNIINLNSGTRVRVLLLQAATNVNGKGIIEKAIINANGVNIEQKPFIVELGEGITANIGFGIGNNLYEARSSSDRHSGGGNGGSGGNDDDDDDEPPANYEEEIIRVIKDLRLEVENPKGKQNTPTIELPSTDDFGYNTKIEWLAEDGILDDDYITISNGEAVINRRGTKGQGGCGGHEETITELASDIVEIFCGDGGDDGGCGGDEGGSTGPGGKKTIAYLVGVVKKGEQNSSKEFKVTIPWGWGREITVEESTGSGNEGGSGGHDDGGCGGSELKPIDDLTFDLWLNQFPLILSASELAEGGNTITDYEIFTDLQDNEETVVEAVYEEEREIVECKIADDGRLWIKPVGAGTATISAMVSSSKAEGGCGNTEATVDVSCDSGSGEQNEVEVEISITIMEPDVDGLSDEELVAIAKGNLELLAVSSGHGPKQVNKVILPYTDYLGYQTKIKWEVDEDDSEFISIDKNRAIIYRRGKDTQGGGCGGHEETLQMLSAGEIEILCGDDSGKEGGCGGDKGDSDKICGRINTAILIASIKKGDASAVKVFEIIMPWGWGRKIMIK